jgi:hypothetical protein
MFLNIFGEGLRMVIRHIPLILFATHGFKQSLALLLRYLTFRNETDELAFLAGKDGELV